MKKYILALAAASAACFALWSSGVVAADHNDPPAITGGGAEDIADLYTWHYDDNGTQKLVAVLTFAGPNAPVEGQAGTYDRDVLYGIHIDDDDADNEADTDMWIRFATNNLGEQGIQVLGVPGAAGAIVGAVETNIVDGDVQVFAGLRDDPFFMDLSGFGTTLATSTLAFDSTNDDFAGQNITAVVIEIPYAAAQGGAGPVLNVWASARRLGQ